MDAGKPVNKVLTTYVPPNGSLWGDHIQNNQGVIRLLNEYSNVVYSLCYAGYAAGSDPIPTKDSSGDSNSVSLVGSGSAFDDFTTWSRTNFTVGAINAGQTLIPTGGIPLAVIWHMPENHVIPLNTNVPPFSERNPSDAQSKDNLEIHYGYPDALYTLPSGTLYHRRAGYGWATATMQFLAGSKDASSNSYVRGTIPLRTYARATTIEYVIEAVAGSGTATTYIGYDPTNTYALFDTLNAAQASPFTYTFQVHPEFYIDHIATNSTAWIFYTAGNEPSDQEPFTSFRVRSSTNIRTSLELRPTSSFTVTPVDAYGSNIFTVTKDGATSRFYRVDPLYSAPP